MAYIKKQSRKSFFLLVAAITGLFTLTLNAFFLNGFLNAKGIERAYADTPVRGEHQHEDGPRGGGGQNSGSGSGSGSGDGCGCSGNCCGNCQGGQVSCFAAGTPVLMSDGSTKAIEQIEVGDLVMAFDGFGELVPQPVINLLHHESVEVVKLNDIVTTKDHRFLLDDGTYKAFGEIAIGEGLVLANGDTVTDWSREEVEAKMDTYNLTVESLHTYVAGGFRVHNWK